MPEIFIPLKKIGQTAIYRPLKALKKNIKQICLLVCNC